MKNEKFFKLALAGLALLLLIKYEDSRDKQLDWIDLFGNIVVAYLFVWALTGRIA